jgi:carbon storage regulator
MLVLTREKNQSIMLGPNVEVTIISISNKRVRLGIAAPRFVPVHRKEIYDAIRAHDEQNSEMVLIHS